MKRIYLVRHGESVENKEERYVGNAAPLTELGVRQAEFVAERFKTIPFDIVLTSVMERAKHTGRLIAEQNGKQIEHYEIFNEFRPPSFFMGKSFHDPIVPETFKELEAHIHGKEWHHSDEENFFDLKARTEGALSFLLGRSEETIVVVTHGMFLKTFTCLILAGEAFMPDIFMLTRKSMRTRNTGITICEHDGKDWYLLAWNDHAHLGEPSIKTPEVLA